LSLDEFFFTRLKQEAESLASRSGTDAAIATSIVADLLPHQRAVLDDPYQRKAVLCPRRAGKSWTAMAIALHEAMVNPGALCAIVTLTAGSAQRIYWQELLRFAKRYGISLDTKGQVNNTSLTMRFENGSTLFLVGAATRAEIEKLRGQSYDFVCIDECKSFNAAVLQELVEEILDLATADSGGTIMMIGTPGNVLDGPFYEATFPGYLKRAPDSDLSYPISRSYAAPEAYWSDPSHDHIPEWSFHSWSLKQNTAVKDKHGRTPWENALESKKRKRWADDNPKWRREALGEWATSDDVLVYAFAAILASDGEQACRAVFAPGRGAQFDRWGLSTDEEWRYILGIDFGFEDDTAICVLAYSLTSDTLYQVYDYKAPHLTASQAGDKLIEIQAMFGGRIEVMVSDGGKQMVQDLNERYGLGLVPAERQHKADHIELLNSDLYDGKFKVRRDSELVHEWLHLQWNLETMTREEAIRRGKLVEDSRCANHLSDATLYAHHYSIHFFAREKANVTKQGSEQWYREQRNAEVARITKRREMERTGFVDMADLTTEFRREQAEQEYEDFRDGLFN
jgi:hypothetical protein